MKIVAEQAHRKPAELDDDNFLHLGFPGSRLSIPERLPGHVRDGGDHVAIGRCTRHMDVETSALLQEHVPLLAPRGRPRRRPAGPPPRHDRRLDRPRRPGLRPSRRPRSALGATYVAQGPNGTREIAAADFYESFLESALAPDEILTEIRVPKMQRSRVELPEVQPPGPGLGDRRRRGVAQQRRRRRGARQHGLDAGAGHERVGRAVERFVDRGGRRAGHRRGRRRRPTSTRASSTASTSPRSSRGAPSKPPRAEPRPERRVKHAAGRSRRQVNAG